MDLRISKAPGFASTGRISTRTYVKPDCNSQLLAFHSQHPRSCKKSIFKGEVQRHLLNCSCSSDFDAAVQRLRADLSKRGYPASYTPQVSYDVGKREQMIHQLRNRPKQTRGKRNNGNIIALKCAFSPQLARIGIRAAFKQLVRELRPREIGDSFLQSERFVIAHPTRSSLFMEYYKSNFPESKPDRKHVREMVG